ncbi:hypothetical protein WH87_10300 [Devosia epidermidihirudinis]|uniref:Polysaccharide pyruvyl transferase domain-containing protein n=2 Tax=Devosia epidermidihirudinis TaxID=1293439 RepID=A0A0F5QAI8_9HYPH|nr:hypothetical protein WH87_10300 [Devosia epidermidihirudinis]
MKTQKPLLYSDYSNAYDDIKWAMTSLSGEFEAVHLLGGGYISDRWPDNLLLPMVAEWLAKQKGARLFATGAGIFVSNFPLMFDVASSFQAFDYISVRDTISLQTLSQIGVKAVSEPDDVVLCLPPGPSHGGNGVALNVQLDQFSADEYARLSMRIAEQFAAENSKIFALDLYPSVDTAFAKIATSSFADVEFISIETVLDAIINENWDQQFWGVGNRAVGSRYHFHYVWSWLGSTGSFVSADQYYSVKHSEVTSIGSKWGRHPNVGAIPSINRMTLMDQKNREFRLLYGSGT